MTGSLFFGEGSLLFMQPLFIEVKVGEMRLCVAPFDLYCSDAVAERINCDGHCVHLQLFGGDMI
jgi:hypothetical protein